MGPEQGKGRVLLARGRQQVEQVPLRQEPDVRVGDPKPAEIGQGERPVGEGHGQSLGVAMRECGQLFAEPELVEQVEGGRVHGVPAEVPQEIGVLLQQHHPNAAAGEQQGQHHPGRPAAGHADIGGDRVDAHARSPRSRHRSISTR